MSGMSSYSIGISGLRNAQSGLSTTGHNVSNSSRSSYTRQTNIQKTFVYQTISESSAGLLQVGLGTDMAQIRQIRNKFFDMEYREEAATANYYAAKYVAGQEVENVMGELQSKYRLQEVLEDVWSSLNELSIYPEGIETRGTFLETCITFLNKMTNINDGLYSYQLNLNDQVKGTVDNINKIVEQVNELNEDIVTYEISGQQANDLRDSRNALLDELSTYADVDIKEISNGRTDIFINGKELLVNGSINKIGLKYVAAGSPFVEPVFSRSSEIHRYDDENAKSIYGDLNTMNFSGGSSNCAGLLKGLLISRGTNAANYATDDAEVKNYLIPRVQKQLDTLTNGIVTMLNNQFCSGNSFDLNGGHGVDIFTKISPDAEPGYTISNIRINPELLKETGYNSLALSASGDVGDTTLIIDAMSKWENGWENGLGASNGEKGKSVTAYYRKVVDTISVEINEAESYYDEHNGLAVSTDNKRLTLSGVSLDEELTSMLKYQYAYQASAKFISVIDAMIDKVVNGTGVTGR